MTIWESPEWQSLAQAIAEAPGDISRQRVACDWLMDHGLGEHVAAEAILHRPLSVWDFDTFRGRGSGRGSGIGSGSGSSSSSGSGRGRGRGRGSGIGSGRGSGSGSGRGSGRGSGSGIGRGSFGVTIMRIGEAYIVHCGDWHSYVGRVDAQIGPFTFEMVSVSKIHDTRNGDCWEELAAGNEQLRRACDYRHHKTKLVVPLNIAALHWVGETPQEAGY